ncbi:Rod binding protein [anaerobic digester metagenome]
MSEFLTPTALPAQEGGQSLQNRLRELRSRLEPGDKGQDEAKLRKACQDFEAVFIGQIWKQMRSSVPKEGMLHSKEEESYLSMFDQELSVKMSRSGGIGLSDLLYENLSQRLVNASRDTDSAKPLQPLDRKAISKLQAEARVQEVPAGTLATMTAQRQAEQLARSIEKANGPAPAEPSVARAPSDLEEALRVVRMDLENGD